VSTIIIPEMISEWIPLIFYYSGIDTGIFHNPWNFAKPVSIPPINFDRNKYELFFIFIYYCPNVLVLIKIDESNINKKFINLK
jgi:hypothetical protein